jgi:hypothetical protein
MSETKMCPMTRMLNPGIEGFACARDLCEWWVDEIQPSSYTGEYYGGKIEIPGVHGHCVIREIAGAK